jgi:hypothetical protein
MPRPSIPNLIFDYFLLRMEEEGWRIRKELVVPRGERDLARFYPDERLIVVYPVLMAEHDDPPAKNLFHEILLHMGLGFGPEIDTPDGKRIEDWWWRQLTRSRKAKLERVLEG